MTNEDTSRELSVLKWRLKQLDEYAFKFIDGELTAEQYEPYKLQRIAIRQEIAEKEKE